jgi:uncharacterized membrane protein
MMTDSVGDDRRVEYEALRGEILYSDQACMIIAGALLSGSLTLLTAALDGNRQGFAAWLSPVWLIGYLYITEKRFVIETLAAYLREQLEADPTQTGFGWEKWLKQCRQGRGRFRRFFPYYLETLITVLAVSAIPVFIYWRDNFTFHWSDIGLIVSTIFVPVVFTVAWLNLNAYQREKA